MLGQADPKSAKPIFSGANVATVSGVEGAPKWQIFLDEPLVGKDA